MSAFASTVSPRSARSTRGFALLITITLLAFLVLLLVSLASLTRVETQVAANNQDIARARQNALLALNIALGQLQKHTGPDQRVTAPADIISPPAPDAITITGPTYDIGDHTPNGADGLNGGRVSDTGTTGNEALIAYNAYWQDSDNPRNRHWTGSWKNTNNDLSTYQRNNPAAFNPTPLLQSWLVSGNENSTTGDTFKPTDVITGLSATSTPLDDIKDSAGRSYRLLLKTTAGVTASTDLDRAITAPLVPINASGIPGTDGSAKPIGHYAWWVGDEGVKARANLVDPYAKAQSGESASDKALRDAKRLQSAQRPAIEAMTTTGTDGLATTFPVNEPGLLKVFSSEQLIYLDPSPTFPQELKSRYHDLSVTSRGVLADTKHGGLKRDLSYILSRPSLSAFRSALNTTDYNVAPNNTSNVALSPASTPYATIPSNETGAGVSAYDGSPGILEFTSTWEQLWSFYNMKAPPPLGVFPSGSDVASARLPSPTQSGITPLLVQAKLFYSMQVTGGAISLRIKPIVVLANPYNVSITGTFLVKFEAPSGLHVVSGKFEDPALPPVLRDSNPNGALTAGDDGYVYNVFTKADTSKTNPDPLSPGGLAQSYLSITATIPPGIAQIFSVDSTKPPTTITNKNDAFAIPMENTYNPLAYVTNITGLSIKPGDTHASLYSGSSSITPVLYMGNTTDDANRIVNVVGKAPTAASGAPTTIGFFIYPMSSGYQNGGGFFCALQDGQSSTQQGMFSQVNYRTLSIDTIGSTGLGDHPLQWGIAYAVVGDQANTPESAFNPSMSLNLLPPPGGSSPTTTRWGLVGNGYYPSLTIPPPGLTDDRAGLENILYDVPTTDNPITSLGQFQHFNLAGYALNQVGGNNHPALASTKLNGFQNNYPISNSYPAPRIKRHRIFYSSAAFSRHYDGGYLWNDLLWDRFTLSSFPQSEDFDFTDENLINSRYRPWRSAAAVAWDNPALFRGTFNAAENLLVNGAFNINSTSVEAWKALFSSLKNIPVGDETTTSAPFARTRARTGKSANAADGISSDAWQGFRDISSDEIQKLAEEMVLQVRLRGPFTSLSEFVNRRLTDGPTSAPGYKITPSNTPDPYRLGISGALQAAIDKVINLPDNVPAPSPSLPYGYASRRNEKNGNMEAITGIFKGLYLGDLEYRMPTRIAGYPGYLLQGDVLSALGPNLTARSDTFTIRTYGDAANPVTGDIEGRAWCEAVVQRIPDYVDTTPAADTPAPGSKAEAFGRRYQIVSFRWLSPEDI
jgi:hypothetical protein